MPDHQRGYTRKTEGVKPSDEVMAKRYRDNQQEPHITFNQAMQDTVINEIQNAANFQHFKVYMVATDPTHLHVLCGWDDPSSWEKRRNGIRQSITRMLNRDFGKRTWLAENASRKQVKNEKHFDHLRENYLPDHRGLKWRPDRGTFK